MKKNLSLILAVVMVSGVMGCSGVSAATTTENTEIAQQVTGSEEMVSVRNIFKELGYDINWEQTSKTLYASKNKNVIEIKLNSDVAVLNGENIKMNKEASLENGALAITVASIEALTDESINGDGSINSESEESDDSWKENKVTVDLSSVKDSKYTITKGGVYTLSGTYKGMIYVNSSEKVKLVLNGVSITNDNGPAIYFENSKKGIIESSKNSQNTLTDGTEYSVDAKGCIFSNDDIDIQGEGTITIKSNYNHGIASDDDIKIDGGTINIDAKVGDGIHANDGVNIKSGTVNIEAMGDGISGDKYVEINTGTVNITTKGEIPEDTQEEMFMGKGGFGGERPNNNNEERPPMMNGEPPEMPEGENANQGKMPEGEPPEMPNFNNNVAVTENGTEETTQTEDSVSSKGIKSDNLIEINGGSVDVTSTDHSIKCDNLIVINDGNIKLKSDISKGIKAMGCLFINGGDISIDTNDEAIESKETVTINGGNINIKSQDDGLNAGGGSGAMMMNNIKDGDEHQIVINGGKLVVNSKGDGLDSNGNLYFYGGEVIVNGPTSGGDAALDSSGENTIYGGTVFAVGSIGMVECPKSAGTQNIFNISLDSLADAGSSVVIMDSDNNTIYEAVPEKEFQSIIFSSPDIKTGKEYYIYVNGKKTVTLTAVAGVTKYGSVEKTNGRNRGEFNRSKSITSTTN